MRHASHRPAALTLAALLTTAALSGCSDPPRDPAAQPSTPADICTRLVTYWALETLKGSSQSGIDWEQKGLSNEQYALHENVVRAARIEQKRHGTAAAQKLIERQTRERCTAQHGATGSSENWRPPT
ncbi:hypothetical protein ABZS81_29605 [Streptomyces sp. NPDC005318]|uniref:hypothetical protein n=1 Tax=Streptomyces sp. NPDC005318 TaxID=3157031 RepID=UPI0033A6A917